LHTDKSADSLPPIDRVVPETPFDDSQQQIM